MDKIADKRSMSGFTITELMMVIAICAILLVIGVPSFKYVTVSNRISTEVNGLLGDMQYARSMAIKQGLPVTVCASTDGANCNGGAAWQSGWIVFLDSNANQIVDANEAVLRAQTPFQLHRHLRARQWRVQRNHLQSRRLCIDECRRHGDLAAARLHRQRCLDSLPRDHAGGHAEHREGHGG